MAGLIKKEEFISDHSFVHITVDQKVPPVQLTIPQEADIHRRYFPRNGVKFEEFNVNSQSQF